MRHEIEVKMSSPVASFYAAFLEKFWASEQANNNCTTKSDVVDKSIFSSLIGVKQTWRLHFPRTCSVNIVSLVSFHLCHSSTYDFSVAL